MEGIMQKMQKILIKVLIIVGIPIVVLSGLTCGFLKTSASASAYNGDYSSYVDLGDYIVKTDEEDAMPALTKDQLKKAIKACYSGKMYENCMSVVDDLVSVQKKYKVNAAFMLAVAQKESSCGTGWAAIDPNSHNWFSILYGKVWNGASGKTCTGGIGTWCWYDSFNEAVQKYGIYMTQHDYFYFGHGEYTVAEIAPHFAGKEWEEGVKGYLDKLYASVAPEGGTFNGDTYSYAGKTYKLFTQGSYNYPFGGGRTIAGAGCGATSVAICVSAYKKGEDPATITQHCISKGYNYTCDDNWAITRWLGEYGLSGDRVDGFDMDTVLKHIRSGKPVIFNYGGSLVMNDGSSFYTDGHFVTLLGEKGNDIFVGDPAGLSGYISKKSLLSTAWLKGYYLVDKK